MKKKSLFVITFSLITITLSSCSFINDYFSDYLNYGRDGEKNTFSQVVASSHQPISDVPTPPADNLSANKASKIYSDFISNNVYPLSCTPSQGNAKLLVIPVWFNNSNKFVKDNKKDSVRSDIQNCYFGSNDSVGWRSVKTYYEEESHGSLQLNGTVSEWYKVNSGYEYYSDDPASDTSAAPKTVDLAEKATDWYFSNHTSEKRTDYDCDGDGYLDGVMLIYAAPDSTALNKSNADNLWAYCCWVQDYKSQNPLNPCVNAFFWASYDFMYGTEVASSRAGTSYHSGDTASCALDTHTYIHEMGHMFGLEDYYDYSARSYAPAGGFSMQDLNVGGHDPFSSFALGWGKAYVPTDNATIDLKPFSTSGEMILLTPQWNEYNSAFDEYILLEYFTDTGVNEFDTTYKYMSRYGKAYPLGTKEYGIRVWHVDARLLYTADGNFSANKYTSNPDISRNAVALMMSNTYDDGTEYARQYVSLLASDPDKPYYNARYAQFNLLQLIRNKAKSNTKPTDLFDSSSLFKAGDSFSMNSFANQFVNSGKLDTGIDLGFTFEVNACNNTYASITIKKA